MKTHKLEVIESTRYNRETEIVQTARNMDATLERYGFGFVTENESARKVCGGPLVQGPWAYAYRISNVIDGKKPNYNDVEFNMGDRFEIGGYTFQSRPDHNENMALDLVS